MYKITLISFYFLFVIGNKCNNTLDEFLVTLYEQLLLFFFLELRAHVYLLLGLGWPVKDQWVICFLLCITALGLLLTSLPPVLLSPVHSFHETGSIFLK